jgi:membrane protein implicated in regulation of membrane protease activity
MNGRSDRLHRRRCLGFRVAFFLGILLAVINRDDWALLGIALAGIAIVAIVYWRDCRQSRHRP